MHGSICLSFTAKIHLLIDYLQKLPRTGATKSENQDVSWTYEIRDKGNNVGNKQSNVQTSAFHIVSSSREQD